MRIVEFYGVNTYIRANILTPFFYAQEFNRDFYTDLTSFLLEDNKVLGIQIVWAMSKSDDFNLIDYDQWILLFKDNGGTNWEQVKNESIKFFEESKVEIPKGNTVSADGCIETKLLMNAVRSGIPLELLKLLRPVDLLNSMESDSTESGRKATQEDIDRLFG